MKVIRIPNEVARLVGQRFCSVWTVIDSMSLYFFMDSGPPPRYIAPDSAVVDISEGFEIAQGSTIFSVRQGDDLAAFRRSAAYLIELITHYVTRAEYLPSGDLELEFDNQVVLRLLKNECFDDALEVHFKGPQ